MTEQRQVVDLCQVYNEMDNEGKKLLVKIATKFLDVQKILDNERLVEKSKNQEVEENV